MASTLDVFARFPQIATTSTCVNAWRHPSCADDPALVRDFLRQCPAEGPCRGVLLGSKQFGWALEELDSSGYEPKLGMARADRYQELEPLIKYLSHKVRALSGSRNASVATGQGLNTSRVHRVT